MATVYEVKIKTVSAFCSYEEKDVKKIFEKFLEKYKDDRTGLGFESSKVEVTKIA